jgi:hypothetical protein
LADVLGSGRPRGRALGSELVSRVVDGDFEEVIGLDVSFGQGVVDLDGDLRPVSTDAPPESERNSVRHQPSMAGDAIPFDCELLDRDVVDDFGAQIPESDA